MINFSGVDYYSIWGRFLRKILSLVPPNLVVPIIQGPLRGKKWVVGSSTNGCWLGSYELEKQRSLAGYINPGIVVYDIGAHVGFYTLFFSTMVGPQGKVYAFEPARKNLNFLYKHIKLNHLANVIVREAAVGHDSGQAEFIFHPHASSTSYLATDRAVSLGIKESVQQVTLDDFIQQGHPPPDFIKMDIEGAEFLALQGMRQLLLEKNLCYLSLSMGGKY